MNKKEADSLFRVNDIRSIYGEELNENSVYEIARAFCSYIKEKTIILGQDTRISSPKLAKAFIRGVIDSGTDVLDIGLIDTPGLYFATAHFNLHGAMITASHNPPKYNGVKLCKPNAIPLGDINGLLKIKKIALNGKFRKIKKPGELIKINILDEYVKHILSFVDVKKLKPLLSVFDSGNGMGGLIVPKVYQNLPLKIIPLYFDLNGNFPNHIPNPAIYSNLKDLQIKVIKSKAKFGVALDGDADRVFFIDEKGKIVDSSITSSIIFNYYFKNSKNKRAVYSSTCSKIFSESVNKVNGKAFREKVGHLFIKYRMRKENAIFGCEETGHLYYKDNFYADSGIISSVIMYQILSTTGKNLSDLVKPYLKYFRVEEISLKVKDRKAIINNIEKIYEKKEPKSINHFDGLAIDFDNYWFEVKCSNTEPLLRVNLEANSKKILEEKTKELIDFIKEKDKTL